MDALAALRLQIEWGADEALADAPVDRLRPKTPDRPRLIGASTPHARLAGNPPGNSASPRSIAPAPRPRTPTRSTH